jgi:hypothetical protein
MSWDIPSSDLDPETILNEIARGFSQPLQMPKDFFHIIRNPSHNHTI